MISFEEALNNILWHIEPLGLEKVPLLESLGRVIGEDVFARWNIPPLDNSAMDGYALRFEDVEKAFPDHPVRLEVIEDLPAGSISKKTIGRGQAITLSFICSISGILILVLLPALKSIFWLYLYAVLFGLGFGSRGPIMAAMIADMFSGKHFGSIYGFINIGNGIGGALGPWLGGFLHDLTGSYRIAFSLCIPALVLANIFFWIAARNRSSLHS